MPTTAQLSPEFSTPATAAQARVLFCLVRAFQEILHSKQADEILNGPAVSWLDCLVLFGEVVEKELGELATGKELPALWDLFLKKSKIRHLPKDALALLGEARESSENCAKGHGNFLGEVHAANLAAFAKVKSVLGKQNLDSLLPPSAVTVEIEYDPEGRQYCAATSRSTRIIRLGYQEVPHILLGLVIADLLLAHEYLSHLVPQNRFLDNIVRENWLVVFLERAIVQHEPRYKRLLWKRYRDLLTLHVIEKLKGKKSTRQLPSLGRSTVDDSALDLHYRHSALFWSLTAECLEQPESLELANRTSQVFSELDTILDCLDLSKLYKIAELHELLRKAY